MEKNPEIVGVKEWITEVTCSNCGRMIQHYPIYLPADRPTPSEKSPGSMDPPKLFHRVCVECLPKMIETMIPDFKKGKLFPLKIW